MNFNSLDLTLPNLDTLSLNDFDFEYIRENKEVYIDKTEIIYKLVNIHEPLFFCRPKVFGKSLLIRTIKSLFEHGLEYFDGLKISKRWDDDTYPVLHIQFGLIFTLDFKSFIDSLHYELYQFINNNSDNLGLELGAFKIKDPIKLFAIMMEQLNKKIVVLVDDYDLNLVRVQDKPKFHYKVCLILKKFHKLIITYKDKLRFTLVTGSSWYHYCGITLGLENLKDVSFNKEFATLLGFTKEEIDVNLAPFIENVAKAQNTTSDAIKEGIKNII